MNTFTKLTAMLLMLACNVCQAKEWAFDVYLDKTKIGLHTFTLNEAQELVSKARFKVKVLFINAYDYDHTAVENWHSGCLKNLNANTVENGTSMQVKGLLNDSGFIVDDGKNKQLLPECPMTFAYWNQKILSQSKLLNPQNAEWLDTRVTKLGNEMLEVKGKIVETARYRLNATLAGKPRLNIDLWYATLNNEWVALQSITPEGYTIHYKLKK